MYKNQDPNFNYNKLTNSHSIRIDRNHSSDKGLTNKNYVSDELNKDTNLRFKQTVEKTLKVSVVNEFIILVYTVKLKIQIQHLSKDQIHEGIL